MKDCKKIHPLLPFYIEGQLSAPEKNQVEKHLSTCETARGELEHFRQLLQGLKNMPEPPVPTDLHGKIMAKLGQQVPPIPKKGPFWGLPVWALTAAAVLVFILLNQYPTWRDTLRVQKPKPTLEEVAPAPAVSSNLGPLTNAPASGFAKAMPGVHVKELGAPKKEIVENYNANNQVSGASADITTGANERLALAPQEQTAPAAAPMANLAKTRKAKKAMPEADLKAETNLPPAAAPEAIAPPAPTPTVAALDQSMRSLLYSQEQSVMTWNGNNGPSTVESQELVTDAETFQKYWQVPHPGETPPVVDFTKNAVVVLMAGEKPTAGYSIHVSRLEEKADQLVIHYNVESPSGDMVVAQILTHPWVLQVIPKPSKPVVFQKDP